MRGNHILGRQDYIEPPPMTVCERSEVDAVEVVQKQGTTTWWVVLRDGQEIGFVTTRMAGQAFRTPGMVEWAYVANDWNESDPKHGKAVLALLRHLITCID